jgi:CheY-like chemotaxis protein
MPLPPDIIVVDYHLSGGDLGTATIAALRERAGRPVPAIVMSSDRSRELREILKSASLPFLAKPLVPAKLRATIGFVLTAQSLKEG